MVRGNRFERWRLWVGLFVLLAGCSGANAPDAVRTDASSTEETSAVVATTATTVAATSTEPTTTVAPSPTENPAELLASVNAAMAAASSFLADFEQHLKDSATAPSELAAAHGTGGQHDQGNAWVSGELTATNPALTGNFHIEGRTVDGTDYDHN